MKDRPEGRLVLVDNVLVYECDLPAGSLGEVIEDHDGCMHPDFCCSPTERKPGWKTETQP